MSVLSPEAGIGAPTGLRSRPSRPCGCRGSRGFTIVEVLCSISLFSVGAMAYLSAAMSAESLQARNRSRMEAMNVARQVLERLQGEDFDEIYARFNTNPSDDPEGANTAVGNELDRQLFNHPDPRYANLLPRPPEGTQSFPFEVTLEFPDGGNANAKLSETLQGTEWPSIDLNADGVLSNDDNGSGTPTESYIALPVKITVTWEGGELVLRTILMRN